MASADASDASRAVSSPGGSQDECSAHGHLE